MNGVEEQAEEGEVEAMSTQPTKVHVRGLDQLNTHDIESWAREHYPTDLFRKVQWVDDTSANLIYDTEIEAAEALNALSAEAAADPLQVRLAKPMSTHPNTELQIRQAVVADVKVPGAKDRSKYYLLHKEWDPDNPDNVRPGFRKRKWDADNYARNKYRRRDYGDRYQRRESRDEGNFHEDMYDEGGAAAVKEARRQSYSSSSDRGRRKVNYEEDLFANNQKDRLRNRSASPDRDGDGRYGFAEDQPRRQTARARSRTPPGMRGGRDNRGARDNLRRELFPGKKNSSALTNGHTNSTTVELFPNHPTSSNSGRELFPNRPSSSNSGRELFPDKLNGASHRRKDAKDLHPDEVADAIGRYTFDGASEHRTYSRSGHRPERRDGRGGRDLFSRVNGGLKVESSFGRLQDRVEDAGMSIKGASRADDFSVRGASRASAENPLVRELFPMKVRAQDGNGGKDLFDGRIKGRGAQRRRAEDLF